MVITEMRDLERSNNNNRQRGGGGGGQRQYQDQHKQKKPNALFGLMGRRLVDEDPREESYGKMWSGTFCPNFEVCSFTFIIVLAQLIVFVLSLLHTVFFVENGLNDAFFLGVQPYTLQLFGMRMPYYMKQGQVWRFFMPLLLNYGATTMFLGLIMQFILGFILENDLGPLRMLVFYLITGIGGTLMGTVASSMYAVGPEAATFGMAAGLIGWFAFNWTNFEQVHQCTFGERLCRFLLLIILVVFLCFIMISSAAPHAPYAERFSLALPDTGAAVGGLLYGFTAILWLLPVESHDGRRNQCQQVGFYIGLITNIVLTIILVAVFVQSEPKAFWYGDSDNPDDEYVKGFEFYPDDD